jgi:hypothetical protein
MHNSTSLKFSKVQIIAKDFMNPSKFCVGLLVNLVLLAHLRANRRHVNQMDTRGEFDGVSLKQNKSFILKAMWNLPRKDKNKNRTIEEYTYKSVVPKFFSIKKIKLQFLQCQIGKNSISVSYPSVRPNHHSKTHHSVLHQCNESLSHKPRKPSAFVTEASIVQLEQIVCELSKGS